MLCKTQNNNTTEKMKRDVLFSFVDKFKLSKNQSHADEELTKYVTRAHA